MEIRLHVVAWLVISVIFLGLFIVLDAFIFTNFDWFSWTVFGLTFGFAGMVAHFSVRVHKWRKSRKSSPEDLLLLASLMNR